MKIEGLEELIGALEEAGLKIPNAKRRYLLMQGEVLRGRVKKNTPADTTLLRESWNLIPATDNRVILYNNVHYALN